MIEHVVEIHGKQYVCAKQEEDGEVSYSFDAGETWSGTMIDAFNAADSAGTLVRVLPPEQQQHGGGFEAFVLALLTEVKQLAPGDSLKVIRSEHVLMVTREQTVLTTRASTIGDVDLKLEDGDARRGPG